MQNSFIAERTLTINAKAEKVWIVLTNTEYISQWDDVPEGFPEAQISLNSQLVWDFEDGHKTILKITAFEPETYLKMNLYVTRWPNPADFYDIAYTYKIEEGGRQTKLTISVGDFESLGDKAKNYLEASEEFVSDGGDKIKALAEKA